MHQFRYRLKTSFIHLSATVYECKRTEIDEKSTSQACFIDFSKAMDIIAQNILYEKLQAHSFRGKVMKPLENSLQTRLQYVNIND